MMTLTVDGKDYTIEYTMEAALCNECTEKVTDYLFSIGEAGSKEDAKKLISSMTDIPQTALTMLYAGLLEHHGAESGDGSITSKQEVKELARQYFKEHKEDGKGNFFALMELLMGAMEADGFFNQIGLGQLAEKAQKTKKAPQDHRKKIVKATGK